MNSNNVIPTPKFAAEAKRLTKKFASLKSELENLYNHLLQNPTEGISLGNNIYKIRLASRSKGKGKSGGFRIITYSLEKRKDGYDIYLITIYDKSEETNITKQSLQQMIKDL